MGGWGGGAAPELAQIAHRVGGTLVLCSWSAASLFGGDPWCSIAAARHARKMRMLLRTAEGADILLIQEARGTEADIVELGDVLLGWLFLGSFLEAGTGGGLVFGIAPRLRAAYPDGEFHAIVRGRVGVLRLRGPTAPPLDVANVHFIADASGTTRDGMRLLRGAIAPLSEAVSVLMGDCNFVSPAEGRMVAHPQSGHRVLPRPLPRLP